MDVNKNSWEGHVSVNNLKVGKHYLFYAANDHTRLSYKIYVSRFISSETKYQASKWLVDYANITNLNLIHYNYTLGILDRSFYILPDHEANDRLAVSKAIQEVIEGE